MQREALCRVSQARGDDIHNHRWYEEKRSGKTLARPMLEQLRQAVREGHIGRLYVWRLDRLTRSGIRDTLDLVQELTRYGCELVTVADGFDLQGPAAEIVLAVMAWAAQMERLAIAERIAAARARVERNGGTWGRPRRMTTAQLARARAFATKGRSVRAIAVALKVPRSTVYRSLSRKPAQKTRPAAP
jgi:DNA invertase Pin-like site-specific DNA recombinase